MLVRRDDLALANARMQTGFLTLNQLAGPPVGAALFAAGRAWPFVAEAVLLAAGVLLVSRISLPANGRGPREDRGGAWGMDRYTKSAMRDGNKRWR